MALWDREMEDIHLEWAVYDFTREYVHIPQKLNLCIILDRLLKGMVHKLHRWSTHSYKFPIKENHGLSYYVVSFSSLLNTVHKLSYTHVYNFKIFS